MEANTLAKLPTPTAGVPKLRYKIKALLAEFPEDQRVRVKRKIIRACVISPASYSRYINLRESDHPDMPATVLREFAFWLNVSMEGLFNSEK